MINHVRPQTLDTLFDQIAGRLGLQASQVYELKTYLKQPRKRFLKDALEAINNPALLEEVLGQCKVFGVEATGLQLESYLVMTALADAIGRLETYGIVGPAPKVALELAQSCLFDTSGNDQVRARQKLKTLLNFRNQKGILA